MRSPIKLSLSAIIALALASPALAQDNRHPTTSGTSTGSTATSRGGSSSGGGSGSSSSSSGGGSVSGTGASVRTGTAVSRPSREPQSTARRGSSAQQASGGGPAIPAYSRPRGDRPVRGVAVDRGDNPLPIRGGGSYYGYSPYYSYYSPYYGYTDYYGYRYYPFYTGFGYFYYDPYWAYSGYGYGRYGRETKGDRDYNIGSLRLKVDPSRAEVYVDGLYRGIVDEFDGVFQRLKIEAGAHRLEIRAPGYQPLVFDVLVTPGETTTYRGDLKRQ